MNERIIELAKKAGIKKGKSFVYTTHSEIEGHSFSQESLEKFAELIVKKCMDVAKYHTPDTEECEHTWLIHNKIAKHFGVEE